MTDGCHSSTLDMSECPRRTGTLSRRWKAFLTRIKSVGRSSKYSKEEEGEEEIESVGEEKTKHQNTPAARERLSSESVVKPLPTFTDTPKKTAHHVSMPAGPVASALSPPPRRIMTKHTSSILERSVAIEQPKAERPPQMRLRLSLDVEQNRQSSILCTSPSSDSSSSFKRYDDDHSNTVDGRRPSLPFRSGTLGTVKSDRLYGDTPPLPLPNPALLTSNASLSSNETLRERRRRRSPLSLPGEEQLTISLRSSLSVDDDTSLDISRQRAMHALEGKVLKAESAAAPQSNLPADALARDKAEYEAVVARSILRRTPHELTPPPSSSSSVLHHPHNQPGLKAPELPSSPSSVFTASC
ncbi:hypothetical protein VTP01DRAFT_565 [Rhizomucor pusillus]|uniref:uncharacterized protein n=1 Tax=Rhizomucor pusillus TaxID=4840 RepID=UPI003742F61B